MRKWFNIMDNSKRNNWSSEERKKLKNVSDSLSKIMSKAKEHTKATKARYARQEQVPQGPAPDAYARTQAPYPQPGPYYPRDQGWGRGTPPDPYGRYTHHHPAHQPPDPRGDDRRGQGRGRNPFGGGRR